MKTKRFWEYKFEIFIGVILIIKIICMGVFSSDYQNLLFMPFVSDFIRNFASGINPYDFYYNQGIINVFPYPPFMLIIESLGGGGILQIINMLPLFLTNLFFKIPNLVFDCVGLYYMLKLFPHRRKYVGILYFASPIVLYSVYMHGQLDLIPTVLLIISIYYIVGRKKKDLWISAILISAALLSKLHIAASVPILLLYLQKRDGIWRTFQFALAVICITILGMLPFAGKGFVELVLLNSEQSILSKVYFDYYHVKIYIPVLAVALVYLLAFSVNMMNKELLMGLCGVMFAVFLALCPPMPGWYVWIVPFVTMFFIQIKKEKKSNLFIYFLFNGLYLIYFMFCHDRQMVDLYFMDTDLSFLKTNNVLICNTVFTLLSGTLAYCVYAMYRLGVNSNSFYQRKNLPFTIGISGDSGTGKSTMLGILEDIFNKKEILYIEGDGDHRWERGNIEWNEYTHLNPKANYLYRQAHDIQQLRRGNSITRIDYNHDTGTFSRPYVIKPKRFVMICGLHSLYLPQMRDNIDLKIYMDTEELLRRYWKIHRDTCERKQSQEDIIKLIDVRMEDAKKYIYPQKKYADVIVSYYDDELTDIWNHNYTIKLSAKLVISAALDIEPVIVKLNHLGVAATFNYNDDLKTQTVYINGKSLKQELLNFDKIANELIVQLDEITREIIRPKDNLTGIIMLFLLVIVSDKMKG